MGTAPSRLPWFWTHRRKGQKIEKTTKQVICAWHHCKNNVRHRKAKENQAIQINKANYPHKPHNK